MSAIEHSRVASQEPSPQRREAGVVVVGLGSIGRRHLASLQTLETRRPLGIVRRNSLSKVEPGLERVQAHADLDAALRSRPRAVVVSNPTALHVPVALEAARAGCHLLIEKPVANTLDGLEELERVCRERQLIVLVGYQFRLHPSLLEVRRWIASGALGEIVAAEAHWGEALPDWHPGEDYRQGYSARRELGGGAVLTLSHPIDYLRFLLGEVSSVSAQVGRRTGLELDVEDVAQLLLRFESGVLASLHLDYAERPASHTLRVIGQRGCASWNGITGVAELHRGAFRPEIVRPPRGFSRASLFLAEMRHFLDCLSLRAEPACSLKDGVAALRIALAALRSAEEERAVTP